MHLRGEVRKITIRTEAGFNFGEVTLEGLDEFEGRTFVVSCKNEKHDGTESSGRVCNNGSRQRMLPRPPR